MTDKLFLKTLKGQNNSGQVPFWFMRQAGRYLPEYRELRAEKGGFLAMAFDPDAACEITMQPIRRFGMDAAIIFSDILVIPYALGQHLEFVAGEGPKLDPITSVEGLNTLSDDNFDEMLEPVYQAISKTRRALSDEGFDGTALIGFAGSPWTVATYMVEGGGSKDYAGVKSWAYRDPDGFQTLIDLLVTMTARYLIKQIEAGAEALQLFDSWASALDGDEFMRWCVRPNAKIVELVKAKYPDIPIIGFPKGAGYNYLAYAQNVNVDALGLDSSVDLDWAARELQPLKTLQGNLDPFCLLAGGDALEAKVNHILDKLSGGSFVFNLGHGINKETPIDHVETMVKTVRGFKA